MLSLLDVTRTLHAHWSAAAPPGVPTIFPGTAADVSQLSDWFEFWIDAANDQERRQGSPDTLSLFLTIHCFSQSRSDTLRGHELTDAVASALGQQLIMIANPGNPSSPLGAIRLIEPSIRTLTRQHEVAHHSTLQHLVVTLIGHATALGPVHQ